MRTSNPNIKSPLARCARVLAFVAVFMLMSGAPCRLSAESMGGPVGEVRAALTSAIQELELSDAGKQALRKAVAGVAVDVKPADTLDHDVETVVKMFEEWVYSYKDYIEQNTAESPVPDQFRDHLARVTQRGMGQYLANQIIPVDPEERARLKSIVLDTAVAISAGMGEVIDESEGVAMPSGWRDNVLMSHLQTVDVTGTAFAGEEPAEEWLEYLVEGGIYGDRDSVLRNGYVADMARLYITMRMTAYLYFGNIFFMDYAAFADGMSVDLEDVKGFFLKTPDYDSVTYIVFKSLNMAAMSEGLFQCPFVLFPYPYEFQKFEDEQLIEVMTEKITQVLSL